MTATRYFLLAIALLVTVAMVRINAGAIAGAPLEMNRIAVAIRDCMESRISYRSLQFDCETSVLFADVRKLDMRADNRERSTHGVAILRVGN